MYPSSINIFIWQPKPNTVNVIAHAPTHPSTSLLPAYLCPYSCVFNAPTNWKYTDKHKLHHWFFSLQIPLPSLLIHAVLPTHSTKYFTPWTVFENTFTPLTSASPLLPSITEKPSYIFFFIPLNVTSVQSLPHKQSTLRYLFLHFFNIPRLPLKPQQQAPCVESSLLFHYFFFSPSAG